MTPTASLTLCQYCEHANAADANFCTGCGAPLHLIPCPQCGAVNQKTSKTCYQCHGQLRESTEILLAGAPATASEEAAGNAESTAMSSTSPYVVQPPTRQRQPIYVVSIIFIAFAAAAYFAYQQRGVVTTKEPAANAAGAINKPAVSPAPAAASTPTQTPVVAEKNTAAPQAAPTVAPLQAKVDVPRDAAGPADLQATGVRKSGRRRAQAEAAANLPEVPAAVSIAPSNVSGSEKPAPRTRPCTEAIAALGLCTTGPTKGNQ